MPPSIPLTPANASTAPFGDAENLKNPTALPIETSTPLTNSTVKSPPPPPPALPAFDTTFNMEPDGFHFPVNVNMYGPYDRLGEGVMYKIDVVFKPIFFQAKPLDAWDFESHFDFKAIGFKDSDLSYLKDYGVKVKTWERTALGMFMQEGMEFFEGFEDGLNARQHVWLSASGHLAAFSSSDMDSWAKRFAKRALKISSIYA